MFLDKLGPFNGLTRVIGPGKIEALLPILKPLAIMNNKHYPTFTHISIQ